MRIAHEPINSDLVDMELIELKFIFDRRTSRFGFVLSRTMSHLAESLVHHDNRDFGILANYQPRSVATFNEQTQYIEKTAGASLLVCFVP